MSCNISKLPGNTKGEYVICFKLLGNIYDGLRFVQLYGIVSLFYVFTIFTFPSSIILNSVLLSTNHPIALIIVSGKS